MKCDSPTLAMPMMATGATVLGLYSHIAHSVDKDEGDIPQPFKGAKPKQTRGRGKPQEQRQNPPKAQEADETYTYENPNKLLPQCPKSEFEAADLIMVKAVTDNFEDSYNKIEAKDLSIVNVSFKVITIREAHHNKIVLNTATVVNPIFREIMQMGNRGRGHGRGPQQFRGRSRGRANYQNNNGTYQYQYYTHDPQSEQYSPPCSLCGRFNHSPKHCYKGEHDINNIMEKMSINPHQPQQNNLYQ